MKNHLRYIIFCLLIQAICGTSHAQVSSLAPTVMGSTGNYSAAAFGSISSSVGEPIVTTVSSGTLTLTQGFEQPLISLAIGALHSSATNDSVCYGSSVTLSAPALTGGVPPYTYNWSPAASLSCSTCASTVATPTTTTTYTLVVHDNIGQSDTASIRITVLTVIASISGQDSICKGNSVSLTDNVSGGLSPYAYSWSEGSIVSTITVSPSATTTYSVLTTDKFGCTAAANHTVTVLSNPTVTVSGTTTLCSGSSTTLTANGANLYIWSPSTGLSCFNCSNPVVTLTANATYTVTGNSLGCTGTKTVSVNAVALPNSPTAGSNAPVCSGQTLSLTASFINNCTYAWIASNGFASSAQNPTIPNASTAASGSYSVSATSSVTGCTSTVSVTSVVVNPTPTVTASGASTICSGQSSVLLATVSSGTSPFTYSWSTSQSASSITVTPSATATYTVSVNDSKGCASNTSSVTVTVNPTPPAPSYATSGTICAGNTLFLTSDPSLIGTYSWAGPNGFTANGMNPNIPNAAVAATGTYSVSVTNNNCTGPPAITTAQVDTVDASNAGADFAVCSDAAVLNANAPTLGTGMWIQVSGPGSAAFSNASSPVSTVTVTLTGTYDFQWKITNNSCSSVDDVNITFNPAVILPAATQVNVSCFSACNGSAQLSPSGGTPLYTFAWSTAPVQTSANATGLCAGNYSCTVTDSKGCSNTQTVSITQPASGITTSMSATNVSCNGNSDGTATVNASGGTGTLTYLWSTTPNQTTPTASSLLAGNYSVTVTDGNGCTKSDTVSVMQPAVFTLSLTPTNTSCSSSSDGTANANPLGGTAPYTFAWDASTGNQATQIATGLSAGTYTLMATDANGCTMPGSSNVQPGPVLTPSITASQNPVCAGDSAVLTASGGTSYVWLNGGQTTTSITTAALFAAKIYSVSVTMGTCTKDTFITVNVNPTPTVSITAGGNTTFCQGGNVSLTANTNGISYSWSNGSSAQNIVVSASGNYSVTVTGANGCSAGSAVQSVLVNSLPSISISGTNTICSGTTATLTANGGNTYVWNNASTANPLLDNPSLSATYSVTGTDVNGCSDTASIFVNVTPAPTASISATATTICAGTTITISASGGSTYAWNTSATTPDITVAPTASTTYSVVVSNGSCSDNASISITVNSVTAQISGSTNVCIGNTITLSASGGNSYAWSGPNGFNSSLQNPSVASATTANAGTYSVTVTGVGGCSDVASITISVNPPPVPTIAIGTSASICLGQSTTLSAGPAASTYAWSTGSSNQTIVVTPPALGTNTYSVTVSLNNCSADTAVDIFVFALPSVSASANLPVICPGDSVLLSATSASAIVFSWNPAVIGSGPLVTAFPPASTNYSVTVQDNNGCSNTASTFVSVSTITATAASDKSTICPGFTVHLNATATGNISLLNYLWTGPVNDLTAQTPSATLDSTATFVVEISNQDGCRDKDSITIFVSRDASCVIYIYNGITPNGDGDNDVWAIDGIQSFPYNKVQLFNRWGQKVWEGKGYNNKDVVWKGTNNKNEMLPDGTYYYNVELYDTDGSVLYSATKWVEVTH